MLCARRASRELSASARDALLATYKREQRALISRLRVDRPARHRGEEEQPGAARAGLGEKKTP